MDNTSPEAVLRRLYTALINRRPALEASAAYYDGKHNLAFAGEKFREAFGGLFSAFADNWCEVVVDAVQERLAINGFRVGKDPKADEEAKRIWEDNDLDLQSLLGHTDGLAQGVFYATAWVRGDGEDQNKPEITVESGMSTIVECHPKIRRRRTFGLRTWIDEDGFEHAELFTPSEVYLFRSKAKRGGIVDPRRTQWVIEDQLDIKGQLDEDGKMPNPLGRVPIVEFLNRPRLYIAQGVGFTAHSELRSVRPLQDAANKLLADMMTASEFGAFPQRWATGLQLDEDDDGNVKPPSFKSGPGKLWYDEDGNARFGQFDPTSLDGYVKAIDLIVQHIASISRTPQHYLRASADRLSGDSIKSAETGLVKKTMGKQINWGASWEELMRLAGMIANNTTLAEATSMETIWADPETRTESEHIDALQKKQALNVPDEQLWEEAGYTPEQVARFPKMRASSDIAGMAARVQAERDRQANTAAAERDALTTTGATAPA